MVREHYTGLVLKFEQYCRSDVGDRLLICSAMYDGLIIRAIRLRGSALRKGQAAHKEVAVCTYADGEPSWPCHPHQYRRVRAERKPLY